MLDQASEFEQKTSDSPNLYSQQSNNWNDLNINKSNEMTNETITKQTISKNDAEGLNASIILLA